MKRGILASGSLLLAACSGTTQPFDEGGTPNVREPAGECDSESAQGLLGEVARETIGARLLDLTGARTLRWVPPHTAVTMDFRPDRLTVSYDDDMIIERIACG